MHYNSDWIIAAITHGAGSFGAAARWLSVFSKVQSAASRDGTGICGWMDAASRSQSQSQSQGESQNTQQSAGERSERPQGQN
jgi:hypothetical protein